MAPQARGPPLTLLFATHALIPPLASRPWREQLLLLLDTLVEEETPAYEQELGASAARPAGGAQDGDAGEASEAESELELSDSASAPAGVADGEAEA